MILHKLFLALWLADMVVIPVLAVLQLGFSFPIVSNYYARYSYIAALGCAAGYHVLGRRRLVLPVISLVFLAIAAVGGTRGIVLGQFNREFVAHIFYCAMPIIMVSYGWHFMAAYAGSARLRRLMKRVMFLTFYAGVAVTAAFVLGTRLGLANYDALGLWNFFFAGPFLAFQQYGTTYFASSILGAVLTAKRSTLVVFVVYAGLYFLLLRKQARRITIMIAPVAILAGVLFLGDQLSLANSRFSRSLESLSAGDLDAASANRWAESAAALKKLSESPYGLYLGAGFGGRFQPWPDKPDYETYYSHYTHFGAVSYVWIGGLFAPIAVYGVLTTALVRLLWKARTRVIRRQDYAFPIWMSGILTVSLMGAVLMNNSYLWFVIGCCLRLHAFSRSRPPRWVPA